MVAAATFQAVRQASRNRRQNPELCEAYDRVAEDINTHDTGRLSFTSEQKEAFVDAQNYATGRSDPRVLTAYARERLFSEDAKRELRDDRQMQARLQEYAGYVKRVKDQYRNPSVHKEIIRQRDALACLDYVVDVEKKLKIMVSAFRN